MGDFARALARTLRWEGGYSNDPVDRGGETYRGISRRNFPAWSGWPRVAELRRAGLSLDEDGPLQALVTEFYRREFWDRIQGDALPDGVASEVFDLAVNCGAGTAARYLQRCAGATEDGKIGPATLRAVSAFVEQGGEQALVAALKGERRHRYMKIVEANPSQQKFLRGWLRRADEAVA